MKQYSYIEFQCWQTVTNSKPTNVVFLYFHCWLHVGTSSTTLAQHVTGTVLTKQTLVVGANVVLMLGRRRRRRANIKAALGQCLVFAGNALCWWDIHWRDIRTMLVQCWHIVYDAGPALYQHWMIVSYLPGSHRSDLHLLSTDWKQRMPNIHPTKWPNISCPVHCRREFFSYFSVSRSRNWWSPSGWNRFQPQTDRVQNRWTFLNNQVEIVILESITFQLHARMLSSEVAQSLKNYGHFSDLGVGIALSHRHGEFFG